MAIAACTLFVSPLANVGFVRTSLDTGYQQNSSVGVMSCVMYSGCSIRTELASIFIFLNQIYGYFFCLGSVSTKVLTFLLFKKSNEFNTHI